MPKKRRQVNKKINKYGDSIKARRMGICGDGIKSKEIRQG